MPFKFENDLRMKAKEWISFIASDEITGEIPFDGFRDYMVKISIIRDRRVFGNVNLYYSPSKNSFSLKTHELRDSSIVTKIETLWVRFIEGKKEGSTTQKNYEAYVDGSFIDGKIGFGVLVLYCDQIIAEISGPVEREELLAMRQIGGELYAVINLIKWAEENSINEVVINYDYIGIEMWANGQWKAQQTFTSEYVNIVKECKLTIHWHKVQGHSGNSWNERADLLARQGAKGTNKDSQPNNEIGEINGKVEHFVELAAKEGFQAKNKGVINNQFIRVEFSPGVIDFYNSQNRSWKSPYFHEFKNAQMQEEVAALWQEFIQDPETIPKEDHFYEVEYFFDIFQPYKDCPFDFIRLAEAMNRALTGLNQPEIDTQVLRYDFMGLENTYQPIKEKYLGK